MGMHTNPPLRDECVKCGEYCDPHQYRCWECQEAHEMSGLGDDNDGRDDDHDGGEQALRQRQADHEDGGDVFDRYDNPEDDR